MCEYSALFSNDKAADVMLITRSVQKMLDFFYIKDNFHVVYDRICIFAPSLYSNINKQH